MQFLLNKESRNAAHAALSCLELLFEEEFLHGVNMEHNCTLLLHYDKAVRRPLLTHTPCFPSFLTHAPCTFRSRRTRTRSAICSPQRTWPRRSAG